MQRLRAKKVKQSPLKRQVRNAVTLIYDFCRNYQGERDLSFVTKNLLRQQRIQALCVACQEITNGDFPKLLLHLLEQRRIAWRVQRDMQTMHSLQLA